MTSIHAHHAGRTVTVESKGAHLGNRLTADFPGWGAANYDEHLVPILDGLVGTISNVNSHGSFPYTRYCVTFADGSRAIDMDPATVKFS